MAEPPLPRTEEFSGYPRELPVSVLLLTTAAEEFKAVFALLKPLQGQAAVLRTKGKQDPYIVGRFGAYAVAIVQSAQGSTGPGGSTQVITRAISDWTSLKAIFAVGFGYGLKPPPKQAYGDIMVSDRLACISHRRVTDKGDVFRGPTPNPGAHLVPLFNDLALSNWSYPRNDGKPLKASLGLILSDADLVDSKDHATKLQQLFPDALGGEMEAQGLYDCVHGSRIEWIVVKAICDFGGLTGQKDKNAQPLAAAAAANLVHHVLSSKIALRDLGVPLDGAPGAPAAPAAAGLVTQALPVTVAPGNDDPNETSAAQQELTDNWAAVCESLEAELDKNAVNMLATAFNKSKTHVYVYLRESGIFTGRDADKEATRLEKLLVSFSGLDSVGVHLHNYIGCDLFAVCFLLTRVRLAARLFTENPSLRNSLPARVIVESEAQLSAKTRKAHWTIVLSQLQQGLPEDAIQSIRGSIGTHGVGDPLNRFSGRGIDGANVQKALEEAKTLLSVLQPWAARTDVEMLAGYVRYVLLLC